jgi:hypothetical protein
MSGETTKDLREGKHYEGQTLLPGWNFTEYGPWQYMGKYVTYELTGASHDPDPVYVFEAGKKAQGLFWRFREVPDPKSVKENNAV